MAAHTLLASIVIIFGLSILVILLCERLKIPSIVGFLFTGVLCGPHGFRFIQDVSQVDELAEIGVILLLFKIGMKLTISKISSFKRFFFITGPLQVFLTVLAGYLIAQSLQRPIGESIFLGFLLSLSSTAIVFKLLEDREESRLPFGKLALGVLIFQDIAAILMMLATPYLTSKEIAVVDYSFLWQLLKGALILGGLFFASTKIVPRLLFEIAKTNHHELFLLTILTICFGVAWLASSLGLSLSLGAFLAGMMIADSEYSTEAIGGVIPYQEMFTSFFFVSIGMLFDKSFLFEHPALLAVATLGVLILKSGVGTISAMISGMPLKISLLAGLCLSQIGEFSFVLMRFGQFAGIGTEFHYQLFLAVSVLTMALTPALFYLAPIFADRVLCLPIPTVVKTGFSPLKSSKGKEMQCDHLIIIGYGFMGRHLARICKQSNIPYVILDMNADLVRSERKKGEPIYFGDATHDVVLEHMNLKEAKIAAILINDPLASLRIVKHSRKMNPGVDILAKTRYSDQMPPLFEAGANEVVPEEYGTVVEIFSHVLQRYDAPPEEIERSINQMRNEGYQIVRHLLCHEEEKNELYIKMKDAEVKSFHVEESSSLLGKTLLECGLKSKYGVKVVMIGSASGKISVPDAKTQIVAHDTLIVMGSKEGLALVEEEITK